MKTFMNIRIINFFSPIAFVYISFYLSIYFSFFVSDCLPSVILFTYLSLNKFPQFISLPIPLSLSSFPSMLLSVFLSISLPIPLCLSSFPSLFPFLSVSLSAYSSLYLNPFLSISLTLLCRSLLTL